MIGNSTLTSTSTDPDESRRSGSGTILSGLGRCRTADPTFLMGRGHGWWIDTEQTKETQRGVYKSGRDSDNKNCRPDVRQARAGRCLIVTGRSVYELHRDLDILGVPSLDTGCETARRASYRKVL